MSDCSNNLNCKCVRNHLKTNPVKKDQAVYTVENRVSEDLVCLHTLDHKGTQSFQNLPVTKYFLTGTFLCGDTREYIWWYGSVQRVLDFIPPTWALRYKDKGTCNTQVSQTSSNVSRPWVIWQVDVGREGLWAFEVPEEQLKLMRLQLEQQYLYFIFL